MLRNAVSVVVLFNEHIAYWEGVTNVVVQCAQYVPLDGVQTKCVGGAMRSFL